MRFPRAYRAMPAIKDRYWLVPQSSDPVEGHLAITIQWR